MRDRGRCHLIGSLFLGWAILLSSSYLTTAIAMSAEHISSDQFGYVYAEVGGDLADYGWGTFVAGWVVVLWPMIAWTLKKLDVPALSRQAETTSAAPETPVV